MGFVPIDRPAQLRALSSPLRQEILDLLDAAGPCAIADLGERLGRPPDSLYFHIRELVRVGLVIEVERRQVGRHAFVVYDVVGRPLRIDRSKARTNDVQAVVSGIVRLAMRDFKNGLGDAQAKGDGPGRNLSGTRVRGWLDARALAEVNERLDELSALIRAGRPGPGRQPVALTWVMVPVPPRRKRGAVEAKNGAVRPHKRQR